MNNAPAPGPDLDVLTSPAELEESRLAGRGVVVIDVLRATTVIARALSAGASRIAPAASVEAAFELKARLGDEALLCGERGGRKVEGFNLGNSPLEYEPGRVRGRTLILASTNGTVILARSGGARRVLAAAFNNTAAVARAIAADGGAWTLVPSGKLGRASLEDLLCAGRLAALVDPHDANGGVTADSAGDGALLARSLVERFGTDLTRALGRSAHGRYLASIGFERDLAACAELDCLDVVPDLQGGWIRDAAAPAGKRGGA